MSYNLFKQLTIWNWLSWFDVQAYNVIQGIMLLLALFRIWLLRFFAFIRVISHLTFAFFRLYSRYFEFEFRVFSPLKALFRIWLSRFFAFIRVISHLNFALFCLKKRYFAFDFRVFRL